MLSSTLLSLFALGAVRFTLANPTPLDDPMGLAIRSTTCSINVTPIVSVVIGLEKLDKSGSLTVKVTSFCTQVLNGAITSVTSGNCPSSCYSTFSKIEFACVKAVCKLLNSGSSITSTTTTTTTTTTTSASASANTGPCPSTPPNPPSTIDCTNPASFYTKSSYSPTELSSVGYFDDPVINTPQTCCSSCQALQGCVGFIYHTSDGDTGCTLYLTNNCSTCPNVPPGDFSVFDQNSDTIDDNSDYSGLGPCSSNANVVASS